MDISEDNIDFYFFFLFVLNIIIDLLQISKLPTSMTKTQTDSIEDIQTRDEPTKNQSHNGQQTCTVYNCNRTARVKGLCVQHLKTLAVPSQSPIYLPMDDFFLIEHADFLPKKRKYNEIDYEGINKGKIVDNITIVSEPIQLSSNNTTPSPVDQTYVCASSITITSSGKQIIILKIFLIIL